MTVLLFILGLLLFIALVLVHEWGHFTMARRNGVDVEEFGLGFPPRIKTLTKKNGTEYTLNWLPLGGFVRLKGEHDADTAKGTLGAASVLSKVKIMMAGVVMNLVVALVLFTLLALAGMPQLITKGSFTDENQFTVASDERISNDRTYVNYVEEGSPADEAGIEPIDQIVSATYDGETAEIHGLADLQALGSAYPGHVIEFQVVRDGDARTVPVQLRDAEEVAAAKAAGERKGYIGINVMNYQIKQYTWSAPVVAVGTTVQITKLTLQALGKALHGVGGIVAGLLTGNSPARQAAQAQATEQVSGPLGILFVLQSSAQQGVLMLLFIIALISLTLAIMNFLPIPALDGGRLFVTLLFRALKKPLTEDMEDRIHGTGFLLLMLLFVLITVVDVKRFF